MNHPSKSILIKGIQVVLLQEVRRPLDPYSDGLSRLLRAGGGKTSPRSFRRRSLRYRGQALVPVVFVVMILTLVAVGFAVSSHRASRAAGNYVSQSQRRYAAMGAVNYAMAALSQTSNNGATYGIVSPLPDTDSNGWAEFGDVWVKVEAIDTGAFININSVTQATLQSLPIFQDNPDLVAAVIQWRTSTSSTTGSSGTSSSSTSSSSSADGSDPYQSLPVPYAIKGANYDTVDELLLVQGMTPTILYGSAAGTPISPTDTEANPITIDDNTVTATGSPASSTGSASTTTGSATKEDFTDVYTNSKIPMAQLFTTVSRERNVATDGTPRINVNTATSQELQTGLGLTAAQATSFIRFRTPVTNTGGATGTTTGNRPGTTTTTTANGPASGAAVARGVFAEETRQSTGMNGVTSGGTTGTGTGAGTGAAGAQTPVIKTIADLLESSVFTRTVLQRIADRVSVDDLVFHENVVNINTAPPEVLARVPGRTHNVISAIQTYRQGGQAFQDLGDFFSLTTLQRTDFQAVLGSLVTKTSTYVVHVKVRAQGENSVYAISALVEMTDSGPHILQWHEVPRAPGWSTWIKPPVLPTPTPGQNVSGATTTASGS